MKKQNLLLTLVGVLIFASCSKSDSDAAPEGTASVQMFLTDAPAHYDAVYLSVKGVEINNGLDDKGWVTYPLNPITAPLNILDYRNGDVYTMGEPYMLPAGKIEQIRLLLNETGNTVVVDGVPHDLTIPSGSQTGLKINFHQELEPDGVYKIGLDFDAARSIHQTGNGKFMMRPVVKAFTELASGQVLGYLKPAEALGLVHLIKGFDTIASAIPRADGYFKLVGVPSGTYDLSFDAEDTTGYLDAVKPGVTVTLGKSTDLGTTTLVKP
ncbi:DUF4382 domain-containing protein [Niabella insulamsoli]|uniref:DUF4382 domain-containing protein n=1 Tax=Niabella insulamsoli TaxID=3144874 RepID=UPI0031FE39F6